MFSPDSSAQREKEKNANMANSIYNGMYIDKNGQNTLEIKNDGSSLIATIRGVSFAGTDFDDLSPAPNTNAEKLFAFTLSDNSLCACEFQFAMPLPMIDQGEKTAAELHVSLTLGSPKFNGGIDSETLHLTLHYLDHKFNSSGTSGLFECELLNIQKQLPHGVYLHACINCQYSDYSPYGNGLFWTMLCFRNIKQEYLPVTSKQEYWAVHGRQERQVQETFLCHEFIRRRPGTGYRG